MDHFLDANPRVLLGPVGNRATFAGILAAEEADGDDVPDADCDELGCG